MCFFLFLSKWFNITVKDYVLCIFCMIAKVYKELMLDLKLYKLPYLKGYMYVWKCTYVKIPWNKICIYTDIITTVN